MEFVNKSMHHRNTDFVSKPKHVLPRYTKFQWKSISFFTMATDILIMCLLHVFAMCGTYSKVTYDVLYYCVRDIDMRSIVSFFITFSPSACTCRLPEACTSMSEKRTLNPIHSLFTHTFIFEEHWCIS